jgi:hypothetical protein
MKHLITVLLIVFTASAISQVDTVLLDNNNISINLDLSKLMDTLQTFRADLTRIENSQRISSYRVHSSNHSGNTAYEINGYTMLYKQAEVDNENYVIKVTGKNLSSVNNVDLIARGIDITGADYSLTNPDPNADWTNSWVQDTDSTFLFSIGYSRLSAVLNQVDGFVTCSVMLDGYNSGFPFLFYLDEGNAAPVLSSFFY